MTDYRDRDELKRRRRRRHLSRIVARIDHALERNAVEARTLRRRRAERLAELEQIGEVRRDARR